jgi:hypothetical protein
MLSGNQARSLAIASGGASVISLPPREQGRLPQLPVVTSQNDSGSQFARRVDERRKTLEAFHSPEEL